MRRKDKPKQEWSSHAEEDPLTLALMHVDTLLERIRTRKLKAFDASLTLQLRKLSKEDIKALNHQYNRSLEDFKAALAGDKFFCEAYSNYDTDQMKLALALFKSLRALKHDDSAKGKIRAAGTRKTRQKTPEQIVKKVFLLEKEKESGINTLPATELVGASELWVYNAKTRKLGCYYAKTQDGLSVTGITVTNYDEKRSLAKTIRKPKVQLYEFMMKTETDMHKYWDAIRAVPQEISLRVNRDTLILRAIHGA
jgi:hypothetical protein